MHPISIAYARFSHYCLQYWVCDDGACTADESVRTGRGAGGNIMNFYDTIMQPDIIKHYPIMLRRNIRKSIERKSGVVIREESSLLMHMHVTTF